MGTAGSMASATTTVGNSVEASAATTPAGVVRLGAASGRSRERSSGSDFGLMSTLVASDHRISGHI
jgi:hypothetical protein